jgi:hypothetical protein
MANLPGMTDEQKTHNLLERIEMLLECIAIELRMARIDRARTPSYMPVINPHDDLQELASASEALHSLRRETMREG